MIDLKVGIPNINTIYLDMDGVLVNDTNMFKKVLQVSSEQEVKDYFTTLEMLGKKEHIIFDLIQTAITKDLFLKAIPTDFLVVLTDILIPYWINERNINVEILSSTMKINPLRKELSHQKQQWLINNNLGHLKVNLVNGSQEKQNFAKEGCLLIDDFIRNVKQFTTKGGIGLHYTSLIDCIYKLKLLKLFP